MKTTFAATIMFAIGAMAAPVAEAAADAAAVTLCRLPISAAGLTGAFPTNLDGSCQSISACNAVGGQDFVDTACGPANGQVGCCIKAQCAGPNTASACVDPSLKNDPLPSGDVGGFVNGVCPAGLKCFALFAE